MGSFERLLSLWVFLAIVIGVTLGTLFPGIFELLASFQIFQVNGVIAVLIWMMIFPMLLQIDFSVIFDIRKRPKGIFLTLAINWLIKPFTMALLGWLFFKYIFANWVNAEQSDEIIAGMILLGVAPCTAMVFVWSHLTKGDPNYTLAQVAINDLIMVFAFAPIAGLLLGISDIAVPWGTLLMSVLLYIVLPLLLAVTIRRALINNAKLKLNDVLNMLKPLSQIGLVLTVVILFAMQAGTIIKQPLLMILIAIPLLVQTYGIFFISWGAAKFLKLPREIAAPACLIGTSNFFELAVAVAISLFGLHSFASLATVVGVLVEVPVMLSLVAFFNRRPL